MTILYKTGKSQKPVFGSKDYDLPGFFDKKTWKMQKIKKGTIFQKTGYPETGFDNRFLKVRFCLEDNCDQMKVQNIQRMQKSKTFEQTHMEKKKWFLDIASRSKKVYS